MKKLFFTLLITLITTFCLQAQPIVPNIETAFKNKLLSASTSGPNAIAKNASGNYIVINTNGDNEIQISEALNVYWLDISNANAYIGVSINYFTNLKYLNFSNNASYNYYGGAYRCIDLSALVNLTNLNCSNNEISTLNIENGGSISTFNASGNTELNYVNANDGDIPTIQSHLNSLGLIYCNLNSDNPLLDICNFYSGSEGGTRISKEIINPPGGVGLQPGDIVTYKIVITNTGFVPIPTGIIGMGPLTVSDKIPNPGNFTFDDDLNGTNTPLVCDFALTLLPPFVPNCTTSYTTTPNICSYTSSSGVPPNNCNFGTWSNTLNPSLAKGIKFTFNSNVKLNYKDSRSFTYQAQIPLDAPSGGTVCNTAKFNNETAPVCFTLPITNNCNYDANFTVTKECKQGKLQINTNASYTTSSLVHTWVLMQVATCGTTTGGTIVGSIQTTTNATFTIATSTPTLCYYIKHTVQSAGCSVKEFVVSLDNSITTLVGNADFILNTSGSSSSPTYTISTTVTGSGTHEWYILSSANATGGPYTPITSFAGNFAPFTATNGLYYTIIHKFKNECGEVCSSQVQYRKNNVTDCCLSSQYWANGVGTPQILNASFNIGLSLAGQIQTVSTGTTSTSVTHNWYLLSSALPNAGPYTLLLTQSTPINNYTALDGVYYFVVHKVKSDCAEVCYGQSICRNCGINKQAIIGVVDCNILNNTLQPIICKTPENLVSSCKKNSWTSNPLAVGYEIEITFNDSKCCKSELEKIVKIYETTSNFLNSSTFAGIQYDCYSWRVRSICAKQPKTVSDWSTSNCFSCKPIELGFQKDKNQEPGFKDQVLYKPTVSPNPNNGILELEMKTKNELILSVDIFNTSGILVKSIAEDRYSDGVFSKQLDLKSISKGFYLLIFKTNYGTFNEKVIIN